MESTPVIKGLNHITLAVSKLETSFSFYTNVLGCQPLARWRTGAYLLAGDLWLCLSLDTATRSAPLPEYTHLAFTVTSEDLSAWRSRLTNAHASQAHITEWKDNNSEGDSIYILDPDGHKLELHIGDWKSRLAATKASPYQDMEFFV